MINIHDYVVENPTAIVRVPVPIMEVVEKIKRDTNAKDMQVGEIPNLRMHRFNAYYLPSNEILNLTEEQLKIKAIRVPITAPIIKPSTAIITVFLRPSSITLYPSYS